MSKVSAFDPKRVLRGSGGHTWVNGKELGNVTKLETKMAGDYEDVNVCGDQTTYAVYNGWSGTGTLEMLHVDSELCKQIVEGFLSGDMPEIVIISMLENKKTGKRERCRYSGITFDEVSPTSFEKKAIANEALPFKFTDFQFLETIQY